MAFGDGIIIAVARLKQRESPDATQVNRFAVFTIQNTRPLVVAQNCQDDAFLPQRVNLGLDAPVHMILPL